MSNHANLAWRKSSHSGANGNCVEFAPAGDEVVAVRNSRDPHGAVLMFPRDAVGALIEGVKAGEFDDLV